MRIKKLGTLSIGTLLLFGAHQLQAATQYKIEDLGKIPDGANKNISINNNGDYTMSLLNDLSETSSYVFSNGVKQEIGVNGNTTVTTLNDIKQATGSVLVDEVTNKRSAFLYSDGNLINIETLNVASSAGYAINNSGNSVGVVRLNDSFRRWSENAAYIYDAQLAQMTLLKDYIRPALPPQHPSICDFECWEFTHAKGINNKGMITGLAFPVGTADNFPSSFLGKLRAFLFDGNTLISLGTLGGDMSFGQAINDQGHVAGVSDLVHETFDFSFPSDPNPPSPPAPDPFHVFLYDGNNMKDLGILSGGTWSEVRALNNNDIMVGVVNINSVEHAFMSSHNGLIDLNDILSSDSVWTELNRATDINDNGVIVGYGQINGETHGFKLVPVEKSEVACLHVTAEICEKILINTSKI